MASIIICQALNIGALGECLYETSPSTSTLVYSTTRTLADGRGLHASPFPAHHKHFLGDTLGFSRFQ